MVPIPTPCKKEQKKIADFLSALDKKIGLTCTVSISQTVKEGLITTNVRVIVWFFSEQACRVLPYN